MILRDADIPDSLRADWAIVKRVSMEDLRAHRQVTDSDALPPDLCPCCQRWHKEPHYKRCGYCTRRNCRAGQPCKLTPDTVYTSLAQLTADLLDVYEAAVTPIRDEDTDADRANVALEVAAWRADFALLRGEA